MNQIRNMAIAALLGGSTLVGAASLDRDTLKKLPKAIACKGAIKGVPEFTLKKLNTKSPEDSFPDASTMDYTVNGLLVTYGSSNECDNSYSVVFYSEDLIKLNTGNVDQVTGLVSYFNTDLSDSLGDDASGNESETLPVTCVATKP